MPATNSLWIASLAVLVHSLAMLVTTGIVALDRLSVGRARFPASRLDQSRSAVWTAALIGMGLWLVLS